MKNALNNQVGMLGDVFLWLEARGHLLHKTGTLPKHFSRECSKSIGKEIGITHFFSRF
jgi:hypothetical protein